MNTQYTSNTLYDGKAFKNDCFTICQYDTTSSILEFLLQDKADLCSLEIPDCFNDNSGLKTPVHLFSILLNKACLCQVKATSEDTCCGSLFEKLVSNDNSVTISTTEPDVNGCIKVDLSVNTEGLGFKIVESVNTTPNEVTTSDTRLETYTIPSGTLLNNGDSIFITYSVNSSDIATSIPGWFAIESLTNSFSLMTGYGAVYDVGNVRLTKLSDTTLLVSGSRIGYNIIGGETVVDLPFDGIITVANLLTNDLDIFLQTGTLPADTSLNINYLLIDKFPF